MLETRAEVPLYESLCLIVPRCAASAYILSAIELKAFNGIHMLRPNPPNLSLSPTTRINTASTHVQGTSAHRSFFVFPVLPLKLRVSSIGLCCRKSAQDRHACAESRSNKSCEGLCLCMLLLVDQESVCRTLSITTTETRPPSCLFRAPCMRKLGELCSMPLVYPIVMRACVPASGP